MKLEAAGVRLVVPRVNYSKATPMHVYGPEGGRAGGVRRSIDPETRECLSRGAPLICFRCWPGF